MCLPVPFEHAESLDPTGAHVWDTSVMLGRWLTRGNPAKYSIHLHGAVIVELGAGQGHLSALCAQQADPRLCVVTDAPHRVDGIRSTLRELCVEDRCIARCLSWSEALTHADLLPMLDHPRCGTVVVQRSPERQAHAQPHTPV